MLRRFAHTCLLLTATWAVCAPLSAQTPPNGRRLIATGPDNPTAAGFRSQFADFDKLPLDGAIIRPTRRLADGTLEPADPAFSRQPWQPAELDAMVADLKECKPVRARDNFLAVQATPGDVDWFDDKGWRETVDHWRLLARAAKLGGLRGLAFEAVPVDAPSRLFQYTAQVKRHEKDFAAYAKVARDRGRDIMLAVTSEFPDVVVLCPRLYSSLLPLLGGDANPSGLLPVHPLGLLPAFLDGWWDAAPPKLQVIDMLVASNGGAAADPDFSRAYTSIRTQAARLAAPEHRPKLRAQMLIGHSVSLDGFLEPSTGGGAGESIRPDLSLTATASAALRASDGWILIEGQTGRWWPLAATEAAPAPWPEVFQGVTAALARARTPAAAARSRLAAASPAENRLTNGDFSKEGREGLPDAWWTWQHENSRGTARRDAPVADAGQPATAVWSAATDAHFGQDVSVKAGEAYALGARVKAAGQGAAVLKVGWKDARGQWMAADANLTVPAEGAPDVDGWHEIAAIVRVPPGANQLVFMVGAIGQELSEDRALFARAVLVRL